MKATPNPTKKEAIDWIIEWVVYPLVGVFLSAGFFGTAFILDEIGWMEGSAGIGSLIIAGGAGVLWIGFWITVTRWWFDE